MVTRLTSWFRREQPNLEEPKLCLELLRGTRTGQETRPLLDEHFQFVKLSADYCKRPISRFIESCCRVAEPSESFYALMYTKEWLRTVVKSDKFLRDFELENFENDMPWQVSPNIEICSNVVPKQAYRRRLEDMKQAKCHLYDSQYCSTGRFFPVRDLRADGYSSLLFRSCSKCVLVSQLISESGGIQAGQVVEAPGREPLKEIMLNEAVIVSTKCIRGGNEGVFTVKLSEGTFAMKRFHHKNSRAKFDRERNIALSVSHPNIVRCFGQQSDSTYCALFMELLEEDLASFLNERNRDPDGSGFPFSFRDSLEVLLQIAEAMEHLHKNKYLHGDLKPGNILVSKLAMPHSGVPFYLVKVADFGCVKRITSEHTSEDVNQWNIGTDYYTAPEVLRWRPRIRGLRSEPIHDHLEKIDVYSFAVIAFQVLTGVTHLYLDYKEKSRGSPLSLYLYVYWLLMQLVSKKEEKSSNDERVINGLRPDFDFTGTLYDDRLALFNYIKRCWAEEPEERPYFSEICEELRSIQDRQEGQNATPQQLSVRRNLIVGSSLLILGFFYVLPRFMHKCKLDNYMR